MKFSVVGSEFVVEVFCRQPSTVCCFKVKFLLQMHFQSTKELAYLPPLHAVTFLFTSLAEAYDMRSPASSFSDKLKRLFLVRCCTVMLVNLRSANFRACAFSQWMKHGGDAPVRREARSTVPDHILFRALEPNSVAL